MVAPFSLVDDLGELMVNRFSYLLRFLWFVWGKRFCIMTGYDDDNLEFSGLRLGPGGNGLERGKVAIVGD